VSRPIEGAGFVTLAQYRMLFTWGFEAVWLHEYRPEHP
jgi:hypothetical protein